MAVSKMVDLLGGLIVLAGGVLPILAMIGVIGELPAVPNIVLMVLIVVGGILLLATAFSGTTGNTQTMKKKVNMGLGFIVFIAGIVLLLGVIGVLSLPDVPSIVLHVLLIIGGFILFLDGLLGASNYN